MIQDLTPELAASFGFEGTEGVLIGDVIADGPADKAGLKPGDIVTKFNGRPASSANQLRNTVAGTAPNTRVTLEVFRDGRSRTLNVTIGELADDVASSSGGRVESSTDLGMTVQPLTRELAQRLGIERQTGVVVTDVEVRSVAANGGIRPGDVIIAVGNKPIANLADYRAATEEADLSAGIRLQILREGSRVFIFLRSR
jgi:serine protease Do